MKPSRGDLWIARRRTGDRRSVRAPLHIKQTLQSERFLGESNVNANRDPGNRDRSRILAPQDYE
jgi:hypothetical protein